MMREADITGELTAAEVEAAGGRGHEGDPCLYGGHGTPRVRRRAPRHCRAVAMELHGRHQEALRSPHRC